MQLRIILKSVSFLLLLLLCIVHVCVCGGSYVPHHEHGSWMTTSGVQFSPSTLSFRQSPLFLSHVCSMLAGPPAFGDSLLSFIHLAVGMLVLQMCTTSSSFLTWFCNQTQIIRLAWQALFLTKPS